jgi:hypothetical protein
MTNAESAELMFTGIDYLGAALAALMILGPLMAGQSHVSDQGAGGPVTSQQQEPR